MNAHVSVKDTALLADILTKQRSAFLAGGPPSLSARRSDLGKLKSSIVKNQGALQAAVRADFGHRAVAETAIMEILPLVHAIRFQRKNLARWMRPERRSVAPHFLPGRCRVLRQPLGVVGIISPWNYPISLALMPLATAIAAGNRAMLKPSEHTPATSTLLAKMLREIFPEDQVAVVSGGADVGAAFVSLPFDHLVFTGSAAVGRSVMKSASANLVPVTLELGGKCPVIVDEDYPIRIAAERIAFGKLANAGQTCVAPDYALVPEHALKEFVAAYEAAVSALYPDGPTTLDYTSIINERHYTRLTGMLKNARELGADVREVGVAPQTSSQRPRTLAPTIVLDAPKTASILEEEIFGPILPIIPYNGIDAAISYVTARPRPLALYYFGPNGTGRTRVLSETTSGNVTVNDTLMHFAQEDLPFGGVGQSGMGAYHGQDGFKTLSHAKGVFLQSRWNFAGVMRPPFSSLAEKISRVLTR